MPSRAFAQDIAAGQCRFEAFIADDPAMVRAAQSLRYRVFAENMKGMWHTPYPGLDWDEIDDYCDHLVVVDSGSGAVVGTARMLNCRQALKLGRFYSESEFHIDRILGLGGRFLEISRTCVDRRVADNAVIACMWNELAAYALQGGYNHLLGSASIPAGPNGFAVDAVYRQIGHDRQGPSYLAVRPKHPIPPHLLCRRGASSIPPLLQAYLRLGSWVCGEPCWDADRNAMSLFMLLPTMRLQARYEHPCTAPMTAAYESPLAAVA